MNFQFSDAYYVNTPEKLEALDQVLMNGDSPRFNVLSFDTETSGLEFFRHVVIGFSVSFDEDSGYYIPLLEWHPNKSIIKTISIEKEKRDVFPEGHFVDIWTGNTFAENVTSQEYSAPEVIKFFMKRWLLDSGVKLVMHNAPFDCSMVLYNFGLDLSQNLWVDTILLKHILDENTNHGLKETAILWKAELGINPNQEAKKEQLELGQSVIKNGGTFSPKIKHVWRGDGYMVAKYGASDTALTLGLLRVGLYRFEKEYSERQWKWFFEDEVMPVCREVVIPMLLGGVYIDVSYFEKLKGETQEALDFLEDVIQDKIKDLLSDFNIGQSIDDAVSKKRLIERIIELEGLEYPTLDKKGEIVKSLAKKAVTKAYSQNPHWLWAYFLGQDELKYTEERLKNIKNELYLEVIKRRYRFNIRSNDHLRWLFCTKLGHDPSKLEQTDSATEFNPIASMNADALETQFGQLYDFVPQLLCFKKLDKLMGSYILPALELNNNGKLHMNMKQHGTISGRFACSGGFNLQTLPKVEELDKCPSCGSSSIEIEKPIELLANFSCKNCGYVKELMLCPSAIKQGFIVPHGYKIINADYSSLEPRCFSFQSNDPKLKEIYQKGLDIYSKIYIDMLDKEGKYSAHPDAPNFLKKLNKPARDLLKTIVLAIPYGARAPQVANVMNLKKVVKRKNFKTGILEEVEVLDVEKGKEYRDLYLTTYPELKRYMDRQEMRAINDGYVETIIGRRRHFQYAPFVYQLISKYGVTVDEFLDAKRSDLKKDYALGGKLLKDGLYEFCSHYAIPPKELFEKGGWLYIRNQFNNEINNARNIPIQGLAGHITNRAMLDVSRAFRSHKLDAYVALQVHDEITIYAKEEHADQASKLLKTAMENNEFALKLDVPMVADPIICTNLKDSK